MSSDSFSGKVKSEKFRSRWTSFGNILFSCGILTATHLHLALKLTRGWNMENYRVTELYLGWENREREPSKKKWESENVMKMEPKKKTWVRVSKFFFIIVTVVEFVTFLYFVKNQSTRTLKLPIHNQMNHWLVRLKNLDLGHWITYDGNLAFIASGRVPTILINIHNHQSIWFETPCSVTAIDRLVKVG